ncbi:MAG: septum formation initiator family protein [Lachnospiraceae bacterium]|nr:septum formation initiator family protein [Lachnospiraceae bacterium]
MSKGRLVRVGTMRKRLIYFLIMVLLAGFVSLSLVYCRKKEEEELEKKLAEKERLERLISEEKARTETIADYRAYIETKSYIEEIAREVLGLVYKDEIIFKPVPELPVITNAPNPPGGQ